MASGINTTLETHIHPLAAELFAQSGGEKFGLTSVAFAAVLEQIATKAACTSENERRELWSTLKIQDLALARACSAGSDAAWEVFLTRFREPLYNAGRAITRDDATARELADSLYAELYAMKTPDAAGERRSKLDYYTGRGSLEGWLRTVLAQEYVNRYRSNKRLVSLEEEEEAGHQFESTTTKDEAPAPDPRLERATDEALRSLAAEDRLILASYFLDGRTLAETAKMLGVHESTISRKVEKLSKTLRAEVLKRLQATGMSRRQAEEALAADVRDFSLDVKKALQDSGTNSFSVNKGKS